MRRDRIELEEALSSLERMQTTAAAQELVVAIDETRDSEAELATLRAQHQARTCEGVVLIIHFPLPSLTLVDSPTLKTSHQDR